MISPGALPMTTFASCETTSSKRATSPAESSSQNCIQAPLTSDEFFMLPLPLSAHIRRDAATRITSVRGMGDFALDTDVVGGDCRYRARLSADWEIWGPCGGYVAAIALRAAGAQSEFELPVSAHCHMLGVAAFDDVELQATSLRRGRRGESIRVSMCQGDRPVCEMLVWLAAEGDGLEHDWTQPPAVPSPPAVPTVQEQVSDWEPWYPFWTNFEYRPFDWVPNEQRAEVAPLAPRYDGWFRYLPVARFDDPLVEAGRVLLLADIAGWPA